MATYEPIKNALFLLIQQQCGSLFQTYARRFKTFENLAQDISSSASGSAGIKQPALYLYDGVGLGGGRIRYEQRGRGRPPVRIMDLTIVVYAQFPGAGDPGGVSDPDIAGGTVLSPYVEAVENVFAPEFGDGPGGTLTLSGLVSHCWIEGEGIWIPGDIDPSGQGMATLPVRILIP